VGEHAGCQTIGDGFFQKRVPRVISFQSQPARIISEMTLLYSVGASSPCFCSHRAYVLTRICNRFTSHCRGSSFHISTTTKLS